jgi:biopolymer transport protein ExbD
MDAATGFGLSRHRPRPEINLVPFLDILLVLLVVFMVAAPVLTHAVKLDLPRASSRPEHRTKSDISLSLLADGSLLWNGEPLAAADLPARLADAAAGPVRPGVRIQADARTPYEAVARALAAAARAGLTDIAFVSLPEPPR